MNLWKLTDQGSFIILSPYSLAQGQGGTMFFIMWILDNQVSNEMCNFDRKFFLWQEITHFDKNT